MSDFVIENGVLIAYNGDEQEIELPDEVEVIGDFAFNRNTDIIGVILPYGATSIGDCAFRGCTNLAVITIPDTVTFIDEDTFAKCNPDLILAVMRGSYAEQYAIKNNITVHYLKAGSSEEDYDFGEFEIEDCIVKKYIGIREYVNIPPYVNEIGEFAFNRNNDIISVLIPDTVTYISECAFRGCTNLEEVVLPESVAFIDEDAFEKCPNVTLKVAAGSYAEQYAINNDIDYECVDTNECVFQDKSICEEKNISYSISNDDDFQICDGILLEYKGDASNVFIPNEVTDIGEYAFACCSEITHIHIPDSVTGIGKYAFKECINLVEINIPDSVIYIGKDAFDGCPSLAIKVLSASYTLKYAQNNGIYYELADDEYDITNLDDFVNDNGVLREYNGSSQKIVIPNGVVALGGWSMFKACTKVLIPDSVSNIDENSFCDCDNLMYIEVSENNPYYSSTNGILYSRDKTQLICCPPAYPKFDIVLPETILSIRTQAFHGCQKIKNIVFPDSLTEIGERAFWGCKSLLEINLPYGITQIKSSVFGGCSNLKKFFIPKSVTHIGESAFLLCSDSFTTIIPNEVNCIGKGAFETLVGRYRIIVYPNSYAEQYMISNKIEYELMDDSNDFDIEDYTLKHYYGHNKNVDIPYGVKTIACEYSNNMDNIDCIFIPETVTDIDDYIILCSDSTTEIKIASDNKAFNSIYGILYDKNMEKLILCPRGYKGEHVVVPDTVTEIDYEAFNQCKNIAKIILPYNLQKIKSGAFQCCTNLIELIIPDNVTEIGEYAFANCPNLTLYVGSGTYAEQYAIENNINYKSIPRKLIIENGVLKQYNGQGGEIEDLFIPYGTTRIDCKYSTNMELIRTIHIPKTVKAIDDYNLFSGNTLFEINVDDTNMYYSSINGALYDKEKKTLIYHPHNNRKKRCYLPDGIIVIGENAFKGYTDLTEIIMPYTITIIHKNAFNDCTSLKEIELPSLLTYIGPCAFRNCTSITRIIVEGNVTEIGMGAFLGCTRLCEVVIPSSVTNIGKRAFDKCPKLVLKVASGSVAERYAIDNCLNYQHM